MAKKANRDDQLVVVSAPEAPLSGTEARDFKRLDGVVVRGLESLVEAAQALEEIRNRRLYRAEFPTFEEYCQTRLDVSRQYANRLIRAGQARLEMETFVSKERMPIDLPTREAVLHELARLEGGEAMVQAYEEASLDREDPPHAADVKEVVDRLLGDVEKPRTDRVLPSQRVHRALELLDHYEKGAGKIDVQTLIKSLRQALTGEK